MRTDQICSIFLWIGFILVLCFILSCQGEQKNLLPKQDFLLGGIRVNEPSEDRWLSAMTDAKMNTVSITVYARNGDWDLQYLAWDPNVVPSVIHEIQAAKAKGMKVVLIPRMMLDHYFEKNDFLWHGLIYPSDIPRLKIWFESYTEFILSWAKFCNAWDVDVFSIGSELRTLSQTKPVDRIPGLESYYLSENQQREFIQKRLEFEQPITDYLIQNQMVDSSFTNLETHLKNEVEAKATWAKTVTFGNGSDAVEKINERREILLHEWYQLIAKVRENYSGKLTYAANYDNYQNIAFWDSLDIMGINAYFELRKDIHSDANEKKYKEIKKHWRKTLKSIQRFQQSNRYDMPLVFTELGYTAKNHSTLYPWAGSGYSIVQKNGKKELVIWSEENENIEERALAIRALREENKKIGLLNGLLYWKFSTQAKHQKIEPFVVLVGQKSIDPALVELQKFVE